MCRAVDDFRFPLMRHWTVYDSIIHSRYVATRLQTWQEKGKDKVKELLVRMGLSQRDCQADYCERPALPPLASVPSFLPTRREKGKGRMLLVRPGISSCGCQAGHCPRPI